MEKSKSRKSITLVEKIGKVVEFLLQIQGKDSPALFLGPSCPHGENLNLKLWRKDREWARCPAGDS